MPLPVSVADKVNVTAELVVVTAPPLMSIEPVGGVVSGITNVMVAWLAVLVLPAASTALALMVLAPTVRLVKGQLHVVDVG